MPIDYTRYAPDWKALSRRIREAAGWRCQGSPRYPDCRALNHESHPVTGSKVILTVAHLDHDPGNNSPENLKAWCQRCHLAYDLPQHIQNLKKTRRSQKYGRENTELL